ncbi:MAG: HIRAN domain-containing protein [Nocardioides sp.]
MRVEQAEQIHAGILTRVPGAFRDESTPALGVTLLTGWAGTIEHEFANALLPQVEGAAKRGGFLAVACSIAARPGDVTVRAVIPGGPRGGERLRPVSTRPTTDEVGMDGAVREAARKAFRARKVDSDFLVYTGWGHELEVVGESHYQQSLLRVRDSAAEWMPGNRTLLPAMLVHDAENPHDPNAVGVWLDGWLVGFLKRDDAAQWAPYLDSQAPRIYIAKAKVTGGTERYPSAGCVLHASMNHEDMRA